MTKVAALGPRGSFSEKAARKHFKRSENLGIVYAKSFSEIFDLVETGKANYGVVPLEDSNEGDICQPEDTLVLLKDSTLYMVGEEYLNVNHNLFGKGSENDIKVIATHPKILSHCKDFIKNYFPDVQKMAVQSSAEGARLASENPSYGAIGDKRLAEIYGLNILRREVHDKGQQVTRFAVVGKKENL